MIPVKSEAIPLEGKCAPLHSATLKAEVLSVALDLATSKGWTSETLKQAAVELGHPPSLAWALFPKGISDALNCWSQSINQRMRVRLDEMNLPSLKVRERIFWAVRTRLELYTPHKKALQSAFQYTACHPTHVKPLNLLYASVHHMWIAAGDQSTDYNFYTKRALLSAVYGATLFFWFRDSSPESVETLKFLEKRIADVLKIGTLKKTAQMGLTQVGLWVRNQWKR